MENKQTNNIISMAVLQAEESKKQGNACMKEDKYIEAMLHYTRGVKLEPDNPTLYSNRWLGLIY